MFMFHGKKRYCLILLALILLIVAGCGRQADKQSGGQGQKASPAGTIKIGWFGPLSGAASLLGQDSLKGAQFAIKEINAAGGINGKQVELVYYDDRGDKKEAVSIAQRLTDKDNVIAVLGGSVSATSVAAAVEISKSKVPMVAAYSNAFQVVQGNDYVWRWASVADVQGYIMADYINKDLKKKTIAVLYQDDEYGKGILRGLEEGVKKFGGQIVYSKTFATGEKEFRASLTDILKNKPDVLCTAGFGPSQASIARQARELGVLPSTQMIASCTADDLNWFNTVGDAGDGVMGVLEFLTGVEEDQVKKFVSGWEAEYKTKTISHEAGTTYDAARFLLDAVKKSDGTREGVKKALDNAKSFQGIVGPAHNYTEMREPAYPLAIGKYDAKKNDYFALKWYTDPEIIDPTRWAQYYK